MKISHVAVILLLLSVFSVSLVHAQVGIPISTPTSSSASFLSGLTSGNSYIYAGFFAIVMFIVFAIALDRTQLSSGRIAISFIFALITFFLLYTDNALLHFFLNSFIVLAFIALILGMLAAVKSPRSIRLIGLVVALFLIIILFENDSSLTNFVNATFHINILNILPLIFGIIAVAVFIILLLRGVKNHNNIVLRVILLFVVFLLIALLIPGFASFLFSPIVLIPLFAAIFLVIFFILKPRHGPRPSRADKRLQKEEKVKHNALSSIADRKQANADVLQEYRDLMKKGNLTPEEQLRMAQLKNKLANEAWQNVADRSKLTGVQYSKGQLSNNKDLQRVTSFFSRDQALRDLKSRAKSNYKLPWSQKRALKKQQTNLNNKSKFISNTGNNQAGDLFDLANATNQGTLGSVPTDKVAKKIFERRISKEARQKDVTSLLNERNKILDPNLNLSNSTRHKELAKIDKKLKKLSPKIVPPSPDKIRQKDLIREQQEQRREEMLEEQRRADAQLAALRKAEEKRRAERARLEEQARLAEEARKKAEQDRLVREQQEQRMQEMIEKQRRADAQLAALREAEKERAAKAAEQEAENKAQQSSQQANPNFTAPTSAFDRRVKTPLWFSHKSPVDENGKLDVQMRNEIELNGLMNRREDLVNSINSGKLSDKELKDARNELNRVDYRLKRYGRDIHR